MLVLAMMLLQSANATPVTTAAPATAMTTAVLTEAEMAEPVSSERDKVICKSQQVTGSFAKRSKVCMTAREWANRAQTGRDAARGYQENIDPRRAGG